VTYPDIIQSAVDEFGRSTGMRKHAGAWYGASPETWSVVEPQKSQFKRTYYLNTGFWIRVVGDKPFPRERDFHIRGRLDALLPELETELPALLDLDKPLADLDRIKRLGEVMRLRLLPLLKRGETVRGLQEMHRDGVFKAAAIRGEALTVLSAGPR
jgi:hypothetical protein